MLAARWMRARWAADDRDIGARLVRSGLTPGLVSKWRDTEVRFEDEGLPCPRGGPPSFSLDKAGEAVRRQASRLWTRTLSTSSSIRADTVWTQTSAYQAGVRATPQAGLAPDAAREDDGYVEAATAST